MDNFVLLVVPELSSVPAAVCLQHRDQQICFSENWDHYQIQSRLEVTSMHAGNRCWQILTSRPRETVNQHAKIFSDEMYKEDPTQDIPDWLQPVTVNLEDLEKCARRFLWKSEHRLGKWRFKSGDTKTEAQYSCLLPQIPKEIYSTNRRDWWLDNSGAQNPQRRMWISEQSPVRCRGTRSHHSVDITRVKTELHRRRRRIFMEVPRAVAEAKSYSYGRLWRIIIGQPYLIDERHEITERAVRRVKEGTSAYCCNLDWMKNDGQIPWNAFTICRMSKTSWQTGNLR